MHIRRLDLRAFGPFTDTVLEFGDAGAGVHILYGPNEAGKSSAREALGDFFFGIPRQTDNDFIHPYKSMAIGAELALASGKVITASRYKRDKNDLVDGSNEPVDEEWWRHTVLGGFERVFFEQMFAIGHETLREGTRGLLEGGGALGETLFAAASGIAHLRSVLDELDAERENLFKKGGHIQPISAITKRIKELQKQEKELTALPDEYAAKESSLKALRRKRDESAELLEQVGAEAKRLERRLSAVELSRTHRRILDELAAYAEVRSLPEDFRERRKLVENALQNATDRAREAQERRERFTKALEAVQVDARILAESAAIEALRQELSLHRKAMEDTRALEQERDRAAFSIGELLDSLGGGLTAEEARARRLPRAERTRITTLAEQRQALVTNEENACDILADARSQLERAKSEMAVAAEPRDTTELTAGLELASNHGDIESRIAELGRRIEDERRRIAEGFASLGLRGLENGDAPVAEDLPAMALPAADTVQRFEAAMSEAENGLRREEGEVARLENELSGKRRELERTRRGGDLPTQEELESARELRDASWALIRRRWLDDDRKEADVWKLLDRLRDAGIAVSKPENISTALAAGFEGAVRSADTAADALWQDARQLVVIQELEAEVDRLNHELTGAKSRRDTAAENLETVDRQWADVWEPAGIMAGNPREMAGTLQKISALKERLAGVREEELNLAGLEGERDRIQALLAKGLEHAGVAGAPAHSVSALVALSRRVVDEMAEKGRCLRALTDKVAETESAVQAGEAKARRAAEAMATWRTAWAQAVAPLGLGVDASTDEVREYVETIQAVCDRQSRVSELEQRIGSMRSDYADYAARVREVAQRAASDIDMDTAAETMILELSRRRKESAEAETERKRLEQQLGDARAELESATRATETAQSQLGELLAEAGCEDADALPGLEERSRQKRELEQERLTLERQLSIHAAGEDLERFIADSLAQDQDQLAARLEQAEAEKKELADSRERYISEIALAEDELAAMQGESKAAEVRQQIAAEAAQLQAEVDRYVRLTVAAQVLRKEMERYRKDHQGPVLRAAGAYFQSMTRGSFAGLEADYDEKGDPVLTGVRPDGGRITVPQMSDGSRDQLYLALRLGALEGYLQRNEPLPFIVDDVLVHFDDDRSSAALAVLADLSRRTQVVFFTHHEHLVDLARDAVSADLLSIQTL